MNSDLLMNDLLSGPANHHAPDGAGSPPVLLVPDSPAAGPVDPPAPPVHPRHRRLLATILALGGAAAAAACWLGWAPTATQSTDSAFVDGHRVAVAAQASGRVSAVLVHDNQHVAAGQVLLRIDPADYQVKLEQAEAAHAQAEGALAHARAQLPVIEAMARQAQAQVQVAEANARRTADDLHRYQQLSAEAVSRLTLEAAATQDAVSAAQVKAAREAAAGAAAQIALARTAIATAAASVRATAALVAQARLNLSYCELHAPVAGFVTRKGVEPGSYIQIGQPLLNLVTDDLFVTANFKETQLTHLHPGQPATITVDAYPGVTLTGRVDSRMAGTGSAFALLPPENATGNFVKVVQRVPVKIVFDRQDLNWLPRLALGMSVIATVDVGDHPAHQPATAAFNQ